MAHSESLKAFFVALERHPGRTQMNVKEALVIYQSRVRRRWFDALARNESFNIGLIDDDLVRTILGEVNDRIWKKKLTRLALTWLLPLALFGHRPWAGGVQKGCLLATVVVAADL
ncbi:hypothetical protein EDB83DRAFT_2460936 [Lactarius deliciosus]|nr:hypothetical protein EDB83DRAFT_2460936 [Lactarius deliciosus]